MRKWIVISAYTYDTPYEDEIKVLEKSLRKFDVPYRFFPYKSQGSWWENCQYYTSIIVNALSEHRCDLVWLDSDAELLAYPELFNNYKYDLGVYKRMNAEGSERPHHWNGGTMYMKNRARVSEFVKVLHTTPKGDEWLLDTFSDAIDAAIRGEGADITIGTLPTTYSYVFNTKQPEELKYKYKVVIRHNQASRRLKDEI